MSEILAALPRIFGSRDSDYSQLVRQARADRMAARVMGETNRQLTKAYESTIAEIRQSEEQRRRSR